MRRAPVEARDIPELMERARSLPPKRKAGDPPLPDGRWFCSVAGIWTTMDGDWVKIGSQQ